jgi:hypothetical protein
MEKIMKQYLEINNMYLTEFYNQYDSLEFLFSKKKKLDIYNSIFDYTKEIRDKICEKCYHFNIYFEATNGNKKVNYQFVRELQENIFYYEEKNLNDMSKWNFNFDDGTNHISHHDSIKNKKYIVSNIVSKYYDNQFVNVGKINYFDDKYKG